LKELKKYTIFVLSLLLVLSNFSYATQQMLCLMSDDDVACECYCEKSEVSTGLIFTDANSPCCSKQTVELSNSNNLQTTANELPKDITSFSPLFVNIDLEISYNAEYYNSFSALKDHIPKTEIPILISSLLI
jgi:hypothetical protein